MKNRWLILAASSLAVCGFLTLAIITMAEEDPLTTTIQQYEAATKKKVNRASGDDLYALAKWCFQNNRSSDAQAAALEANQKAPDDVRPKFLLYLVTSGGNSTGTEGVTATEDQTGSAATISDTDVDEVYKAEGNAAMNGFRNVQPTLINTCGNLKCHGGGNPASKWVLIRRNATDKKTIAENFRTLNKYITRDAWAESPMLVKPTKGPDAGHPQIVMRTTDPAYVKISTWMKTLKTATANIWGNASKAPPPPAPAAPAAPAK
ncbi:MAG: hypothetical protein NT049_11220 [Planctomycetota bacterium]|nr:hypothetical protein [Planctomycetota bacterium]